MKRKLEITFPPELTNAPVTYELIKKFDLHINILRASIDFNNIGHILYEIDGTQNSIETAVTSLKAMGIHVRIIESSIVIDREKCTDCGLCTSVCFSDALKIGMPDWRLSFIPERCTACNHCLSVCPTRAISAST
jgi:ferredoxin